MSPHQEDLCSKTLRSSYLLAYPYKRFLATASSTSLVDLLSILLHFDLLLLLLALNEEVIGLTSFRYEVLVLSEQELEINGRLIKEHTSNGWGEFFTEGLHDWHVDVVTNEVVSFVSLKVVKVINVDLRESQGLLLHHHLLLGILDVHHLRLLLRHHVLWLVSCGHLLILHHVLTHWLVWSLLMTWVLIVLVPVLTVASVVWTSSASSSHASATSHATSLVLVVTTHLSWLHLVIVLLLLWSTHLESTLSNSLTLFALILYEIDELSHIVSLLFISSLNQFIFCLPEIDFEWLLIVAEAS